MNKIPVFFMPEMVADSKSFSPSAGKPGLVVKAWEDYGFPIEVLQFQPCSVGDLARAHDRNFVEGVLGCWFNNGFGNKDPDVAKSLPFTSGSMVAALDAALSNGIGAVSPTSGFHHAGFDFSQGFCTFNGLMVAAMKHPELNIGILDFDYHYGNGTDNIIDKLEARVIHYSQGDHYNMAAVRWLKRLPDLIGHYFDGCDAVLYQAGQDPHVNDPLGGWLTTEQLADRDRIVFETLRELHVPVAWNLAGGYSTDINCIINGHVNTMIAAVDAWCL